MTACREWKDRLLDVALGAPAADRLEAHLRGCAACAAALAELRRGSERLGAAVHELVRGGVPSPDLRARVLAAVEAAPARARVEGWVGVLAAVAVVVLGGILLEQPGGPPRRITSLSEWRSPTDWLLRTPGDELLRSTPRVEDFYFPLEPAEEGSSKGGNNEG